MRAHERDTDMYDTNKTIARGIGGSGVARRRPVDAEKKQKTKHGTVVLRLLRLRR